MIQNLSVDSLLPNPFRKIDTYPIVRQVVDELKKSMEETGVWVGIIARKAPKKPSKYEIAFGHHRLTAIKELKVKTVPVDIQELDDLRMVQQMAFENMSVRKTNTKVILEVVQSAREQIVKALDGWEWRGVTESRLSLQRLFSSEMGWKAWVTKKEPIGKDILLRFLGPHWEKNIIQALKLIAKAEAGKLDLDAAAKFDSPSQANAFAEVVIEKEIPLTEQVAYADEIKEKIEELWKGEDEVTASRIETASHILEGNGEWSGIEMIEDMSIVDALKGYTTDLEYMNTGLPEIIQNWQHIPDRYQKEFLDSLKRFLGTIRELKEKKTWAKLLE